ncbi:hypothetical protein LJR220_001655 [Bradyrhizobium sp. LjRoot220]|uniref:hypothetical protein n=1 Tax=Bradyrhizobium sp. LjRoot220 TaxID=3342284 RepID=UPI003ECD52F3
MADKNPMDPLYEVHALAGETLALQSILFGILPRLAALSPEIKEALSAGFDDAANLVEQIALKYGDQAHPAHAAKALQIVEGIRSSTLGKPQKPG